MASTTPFLGELELAVMDRLWQCDSGDVQSLHRAIGTRRGITLNTVQSTLKRLHEKGLLARRKVSHAYVYSPACSRAELTRAVLGKVVGELADGEPDAMLTAFVDLTERAGPEQLERLERLVAARIEDKGRE